MPFVAVNATVFADVDSAGVVEDAVADVQGDEFFPGLHWMRRETLHYGKVV